MRVTNKTLYALTTLTDLAFQQANSTKPTTVAALSARQGVSISYLESILRRLRAAGLVTASRGPGGGYLLTRSADELTVADIVLAVEVHLEDDDSALVRYAADSMKTAILAAFSQSTLAKIAAESGVVPEEMPVVEGEGVAHSHTRHVLGVSGRHPVAPVQVDAPNSVFELGAYLSKRCDVQ